VTSPGAHPTSYFSLWVDPAGVLYTAADSAVWRYQGGSWTSIPRRFFGGAAVWGLSASEVYVAADSVWRVNASSTTPLPHFNAGGFRVGLSGTAATGLYTAGGSACGKNWCSEIVRYTGTAWVTEFSYTGRQLLALWVGSDGVGYAAGANGVVLTSEGGAWHILQAPAQ
jgi:hypothetical protein